MNMDIDIFKIDDVIIGCANQAGEDNQILLECPLYLLFACRSGNNY